MRPIFAILLILIAVLTAAPARAFTHFEARQTHALALTPDGTRLLALHSPDARLAVFDLANADAPALIAEILVGLAPVAVRARTDDEAWVVSEVSDTISIVSLSRRAVVATLTAPDEPADVVFAQGRAFVTCARSNLVRVFDATTRAELATIPLDGLYPQSLATDSTRVFAAFLHSGNGTTILPKEAAPPQPAPTNTALPAAPDTALIVAATDSRVRHVTLDRDVVEIDAATLAVTRNFSGAGTDVFGEPPLTRSTLLASLGEDDTLTFLGAPPLEGARFGGDLNRGALLAADSYFLRSRTQPLAVPIARGLLANDTRVVIPTDAIEQSSGAALGTVTLAADGSFIYTPGADFADIDSFTYRALIAGDPGNATSAAPVTISTMASAAARYSGHVNAEATQEIAGFVDVNVRRTGAWSGMARLGTRRQPLSGRVEVNGELRPARTPALDVTLQLSARGDGTRSVGVFVRDDGSLSAGTLVRSPYSRLAPAPNAGRHVLALTLATSTGAAPASGRAVLTLTPRGVARLAGRLGEANRFSTSAVVGPRDGGGWLLPVFARVRAGTLGGELALDTGIAGTFAAELPAQGGTPGFSADYAASEVLP